MEAPPGFEPGMEVLQFSALLRNVSRYVRLLENLPMFVVLSSVECGRSVPSELRCSYGDECLWHEGS